MVYPVVGGGHEQIFQKTQLPDFFGMHQDPPGLGGGIHKGNIYGLKPEQGNRNKIKKTI